MKRYGSLNSYFQENFNEIYYIVRVVNDILMESEVVCDKLTFVIALKDILFADLLLSKN